MKHKACHTTFAKGKRVYVVLRSGKSFIDKYIEKKSRFIFLQNNGKIPIRDLKSVTIAR